MWFWIKYYFNWGLASVFGYVIPWWFWALVGLAAAISVFMLLPVAIPERLRTIAASIVLSIGLCISAGSWGLDHGIHTERMKWERTVAQEKLRLKLEAQRELSNEQKRTADAEAHSKSLKEQLDAIIVEASQTPDAPSCPGVVIPESTARRLHNLTGRRR